MYGLLLSFRSLKSHPLVFVSLSSPPPPPPLYYELVEIKNYLRGDSIWTYQPCTKSFTAYSISPQMSSPQELVEELLVPLDLFCINVPLHVLITFNTHMYHVLSMHGILCLYQWLTLLFHPLRIEYGIISN